MLTGDKHRIKSALASVGLDIDDIYDLVNSNKSYPSAIPVLLDLLNEGVDDARLKEGLVRALAVKEANGKTGTVLIAVYNRLPKEKMGLRWAIGNTLYKTIGENDLEGVLSIVRDKENGTSRQMFVMALGKMKGEKIEDVLIGLLDDDDVMTHAMEALGKLKSKRAKEKIETLSIHSSAFVRKEAQKALKRIS
ncbi:HEAT repeat domain-containing protein [Mucilaginibacter sp. cycad4]|uniref:HEAT repeat domain-containing protein n=1 Tax=Mucilaginibacter sp. cycad4 TaxID=3342096 RepID=UPI002AAB5D1D|nr:HEAT repeat domain-containing protein [Mucilaginibacter gossypii]WPV01587.1 HEAT repeat domain-containing protein [Mucilaginibacter gossypii]